MLASTVVPIAIATIGFNTIVGVLGVLYYCAFLVFSLTRGDELDDGAQKKVDDLEAQTSLNDADADPPHGVEFAHDARTGALP